jgi:hypothetical protein
MTKTFTVAGTSNLNGTVKFRFANDLKSRIAVLTRNGHTDINLRELPEAMTKEAAIQYLEADNSDTSDQLLGTFVNALIEAEAAPTATELTVDTLRTELAADGIDTTTMSEQFLADVAAREMISEGSPA